MSFQIVTSAYAASTGWSADCTSDGVATIKGIECLITRVLQPIPALLGLAAVVMIIIAGVRLISADPGDSKTIASAYATMTWAVIGLVLLVGIWFALTLVERFTGAPVTQFSVGI